MTGLPRRRSLPGQMPLGCYGDGGAIFTDDADLARVVRSLCIHGQGSDKYDNVRIGMNGKLDTIKAAVLIEKLKIFTEEIERRNAIAARRNEALADVATIPVVLNECTSVWAQYTIRVAAKSRDAFAETLKAQKIPTAVYYPWLCTSRRHIATIRSPAMDCRYRRCWRARSSACRCTLT